MSISTGSKILASDVNNHINNKSNPHSVTASQIGAATTSALAVLEATLDKMEGEDDMTVDLQGYSLAKKATGNWSQLAGGYEYILFPYESVLTYGFYMDAYITSFQSNTGQITSPPAAVKIIIPSGITLAIYQGFAFRKAI